MSVNSLKVHSAKCAVGNGRVSLNLKGTSEGSYTRYDTSYHTLQRNFLKLSDYITTEKHNNKNIKNKTMNF